MKAMKKLTAEQQRFVLDPVRVAFAIPLDDREIDAAFESARTEMPIVRHKVCKDGSIKYAEEMA